MNEANDLIPFAFDDHLVRVVERGGEPWFVAADVCKVLQYKGDAGQNTRSLADDEKGLISIQTPGGSQSVLCLSEAGMFTLVLRSRDAMKSGTVPYRFRRWVTHEVLPSIRKTGRYGEPELAEVAMGTPVHLMPPALKLAHVREYRLIYGPARTAMMMPGWGYEEPPAVLTRAEAVESGDREALDFLLDHELEDGTIARMAITMELGGDDRHRKPLARAGIRVDEEAGGFYVANRGRGIQAVFAGTRWRDGRHVAAMHRLPGGRVPGRARNFRFDGFTSRATFLPESLLRDDP